MTANAAQSDDPGRIPARRQREQHVFARATLGAEAPRFEGRGGVFRARTGRAGRGENLPSCLVSESNEHAPAPELGEAASDAPGASGDEAGLLAELLESEAPTPDAAHRPSPAPLGNRVGRLVAWDPSRGPLVSFAGGPAAPVAARSIIPLDRAAVDAAIASERGVLLSFEDGQPNAPIITGLLQALVPDPAHADPGAELAEPELETELPLSEGDALEARIDGRRVELEAADEIVLRCGKASIVLRRNGRIVIRGTYVETRSRGVNRIKGGSVEIN